MAWQAVSSNHKSPGGIQVTTATITCEACNGQGSRLVRCCYPRHVSQIECECGWHHGFREVECTDCDGNGTTDREE